MILTVIYQFVKWSESKSTTEKSQYNSSSKNSDFNTIKTLKESAQDDWYLKKR